MKEQEMLIVVREALSFYPIMPWLISITHMIQAYHHVLKLYCLSAQVSKALAEIQDLAETIKLLYIYKYVYICPLRKRN